MKKIHLTQDKVALVDDIDFAELSKYKWCAFHSGGKWYAVRSPKKEERKIKTTGKLIHMHRQIMNAEKGNQVDHEDGSGLNNQRSNLRFSTQQQNVFNQKPTGRGTSKYKGVSWSKTMKKWYASIKHNGKSKCLGHYFSEMFAANVYDIEARNLFGEFAGTNFPLER